MWTSAILFTICHLAQSTQDFITHLMILCGFCGVQVEHLNITLRWVQCSIPQSYSMSSWCLFMFNSQWHCLLVAANLKEWYLKIPKISAFTNLQDFFFFSNYGDGRSYCVLPLTGAQLRCRYSWTCNHFWLISPIVYEGFLKYFNSFISSLLIES